MISNIIALLAVIISLIALIVTYRFNIKSYRTKFEEVLSINLKPCENDIIHAYGVISSFLNGFYISKIAKFYKIQIVNQSNKPISITEIKYKENNSSPINLPFPFLKYLEYQKDRMILKNIVEVPLRMDVGDSFNLYICLPISIKEDTGKALYKYLKKNTAKAENNMEILFFDKDARKNFNKIIYDEIKEHPLFQNYGIKLLDIGSDNISMDRPLVKVENDNVTSTDVENKSRDGLTFEYSNFLHSYLWKYVEENNIKDLTTIFNSPNEEYQILFEIQGSKYKNIKMKLKDFDHFEIEESNSIILT